MLIKKIIKKSFGLTAFTWSSAQLYGSGTKKPNKIVTLEKQVKKIAMSDYHYSIINDDGLVFTWGDNSHGQLGYKLENKKESSDPALVPYFKEKELIISDVLLGKKHTIALDNHGTVFTWGKGNNNRNILSKLLYPSTLALGHPEMKDLFKPKPIKSLKDEKIVQVSTGNDFALALSEKNSLWVWGRGEFGVLGFTNDNQPIPIINEFIEELKSSNGKIIKIDSCSDFSSVLFENGKVFSFGNNDYGNLAIGFTQSVDTCDAISNPTEIKFENQNDEILFKDINLAEQTSTFLSIDNKVYYAGKKFDYYPRLFDIDYDKHKIIDFTACDKGVAVLTEENRIFYNGNFWNGKVLNTDKETGIKEADVSNVFEGKVVRKIGGKYSLKYALIEE